MTDVINALHLKKEKVKYDPTFGKGGKLLYTSVQYKIYALIQVNRLRNNHMTILYFFIVVPPASPLLLQEEEQTKQNEESSPPPAYTIMYFVCLILFDRPTASVCSEFVQSILEKWMHLRYKL